MVFAGHVPHDLPEGAGGPSRSPRGPGATWLQAGIAILLTWLTVGVGVVRLDVSKWLPNLGAVVKVAIFLALGALGLASLASGRPSANVFSLSDLVPRWSDSLAFLPVLLYNALGFELMSAAGDEMKRPAARRAAGDLLSGLVIAVVYTLGVLGILLAVPLERAEPRHRHLGRARGAGPAVGRPRATHLVLLLGLGFLYACVANVVTWSLGVNRVAAAAAAEGAAPAVARPAAPALRHAVHGLRDPGDRGYGAPAGERAPVVPRGQRLLDGLQAVRRLLPRLLPARLPGVRRPAPEASRTSRVLTGCREGRPRRGRPPSSARCSSPGASCSSSGPLPRPRIPRPPSARRWVLLAETLATLGVGLASHAPETTRRRRAGSVRRVDDLAPQRG